MWCRVIILERVVMVEEVGREDIVYCPRHGEFELSKWFEYEGMSRGR